MKKKKTETGDKNATLTGCIFALYIFTEFIPFSFPHSRAKGGGKDKFNHKKTSKKYEIDIEKLKSGLRAVESNVNVNVWSNDN